MAEVHGNRTHLPARHRYAGFEDQEAHQDPGTSVGIMYYLAGQLSMRKGKIGYGATIITEVID